MEIIIILDYATGIAHVYKYVDNGQDADEFVTDLGFNTSNCHWMVTKEDIEFHLKD
jgi:hypothetical protein